MERQSTSKLYRALIAVVAFFVLCTSAILFASCGTDPRECKHEHLDDSDVVAYELATCSEPGTVTYKCTDCGAEVTKIGTLATGEHDFDANGKCKVCGLNSANDGVTLKEIKDLLVNVATKDLLSTVATQEDLDELRGSIVSALKEKNFTIPALDEKLEAILESVQGLGDLEIEGFDPSDFEGILAGTIAESDKVTLADVITALYNQVHRLYLDFSSTSADSLYNLLVGKDAEGAAHVHNWILKVKGGTVQDCSKGVTYEWGCAFCDETKEGEDVTVKAIGHATDYKYGLKDGTLEPTEEAVKDGHYYAATCISPARVEGHCAVCGKWTGEWNPVGEPTYKHNYVLEEGEGGHNNSCTVSSQNVYHCATCGGAYVEETKAPGHNYYYELDENGNKVALTPETKEQLLRDYFGEDQDLSLLTEEQKAEALQPYLNIVYSAEATCVDPGLVVVECVECGVRYSYTTGQAPKGHRFVAVKQLDNTCTTDGIAGYAYCLDCGYFFFCSGKGLVFNTASGTTRAVQYLENGKPTTSSAASNKKVWIANDEKVGGWYSRNYIRKDGKVLHYVFTGTVSSDGLTDDAPKAAPMAEDPKNVQAGETTDPVLAALYEVTSSVLPAKGHHYVPVYTNTASCVTSQQYILVCDQCFELAGGTKIATDTANFTPVKNATGETIAYKLAALSGNNVTDLATGSNALKAVASIVAAMKWDNKTDNVDGEDVVVPSDITEDWAAAVEGGHDALVKFFVDHQGYLVRDVNDDEHYTLGTGDTAKAKLTAELDALDDDALEALYMDHNVVVKVDEDAETEDEDVVVYEPVYFVDPVAGHKFTEKYVTVVGGCTMYERHVYFCTVCGQDAGDPDAKVVNEKVTVNEAPYLVDGAKTDDQVAGDAKYNDLKKEWDAVKVNPDPSVALLWLGAHGYLNEFRDNLSTAWVNDYDNEEMEDLMVRVGMLKLGNTTMEDIYQFTPEELDKLFTGKNVLDEFKVDVTFKGSSMRKAMSGEEGSGIIIDETTGSFSYPAIELGHKFDVISYVGVGETCDAPAYYVYVCSVCGKSVDDASTKDTDESSKLNNGFSFQNGTGTADVPGLKLMTNPNYVTDDDVFVKSVPDSRRGTGKDFPVSDLAAEWAATATDLQFNWLLEKGYLNGVIDSVMLFGYETKDGHVKGELEKAIEENAALPQAEQKTLQQLFAETKDGVTSGIYYQFYKVEATKSGTGANETTVYTRTFIGNEDTIKTAATAIALKNSYGTTTTADLTKFYTQSGDGDKSATEKLPTNGKAANKTTNVAWVKIPESGHIWWDEAGKPVDVDPETGSPLCTGFASQKLKDIFNPTSSGEHHYAVWQPVDATHTTAGWVESGAFTFPQNNATFDKFLENVQKYGIIAACKRGDSCPLHKENGEITENYAFGYYVASPHVTSYEKYAASGEGYPTGTVVTTKVYYNYNKVEAYKTKEQAGQHLLAGDSWDLLLANSNSNDTATANAANKKIADAAQKALDADLTNLGTLQKYWNTLFVSESWLNANDVKDDATTANVDENKVVSDARKLNYPTIDLSSYKNSDGSYDLTEEGDLQALFKKAGVPALWRWDGDTEEYVSAWRPLSDINMEVIHDTTDATKVVAYVKSPSCWVDLRCKWYHASADGTKCESGSPNVAHVYPTEQDGNVINGVEYWYGRTEKLANCLHKDRCMTCGQEIGKAINGHNPIDVTTLTEDHQKLAWAAILNAAKATSATAGFLYDVKNAVWFDDGVTEVTLENYDTAWGLKDACYDGKNVTALMVCSGELEQIYNDITYNKGSETWNATTGGIDWKKKAASGDLSKAGAYNYVVTEESGTSAPKHGWAVDGAVERKDYSVKFYYASNYIVNGTTIGQKDELITVNEDGEIVKGGTKPATRDQVLFSAIPCSAGYIEKQYCLHEVDHTFTTGTGDTAKSYEKGKPCNEEHALNPVVAQGHTLSPVKDYDTLGSERYEARSTSSTSNSKVTQVCVYCGMHAYGEYKSASVVGGSYSIANIDEINAWNVKAEEWNTKHPTEVQLWLAEVIKSKDVYQGNTIPSTGEAAGLENADGLYIYKESTSIQLVAQSGSTGSKVDHNVVGAGKDVTIVVGADAKLTFTAPSTSAAADDKKVIVKGTLAIVGEGDDTSEVDFANVSELWVDGGDLIFENIKVTLNGCSINPGPGLNGTGKGGAIEMKNVWVTNTTYVFGMNSGATAGTNVITIDNSTLVSTGDTALAIFKKNVTVTATDSTFVGDYAGALIRSGVATFTDCTFATSVGTYSDNEEWQSGSDVPVDAALIVGNKTDVEAYGDATVEVYGGTFGVYESSYTAGVKLTACGSGNTVLAIAAYSSAKNVTKLTVDNDTLQSAGEAVSINGAERNKTNDKGEDVEDEEGNVVKESTMTYTVLTPAATDLGKTAAEQVTAAEKLVESVLASGGNVTLPTITETDAEGKVQKKALDFTQKTTTNPLTVGAGKSASVDLGGNVVNVKTTGSPNGIHGDLTITNGTITSEGSEKLDFSVQQGGSLTLDGVTANVKGVGLAGNADATDETEAKLIIKNHSTIIGIGQVVCTNNVQTKSGKITIENSQIIAKGDDAHDATALLVNNSGVTVEATGTTFYGLSNAVWVRASKAATFTDCTFISGGVNTTREAGWNGGNEIDPSAMAALVVGDNATTSYGDATVYINGTKTQIVRGKYNPSDTTHPDTITFNEDGTLKTYAYSEYATAKSLVVASDTDTTTVIFENKALSDAVLNKATAVGNKSIVGLVKGENVFYTDKAGKVFVKYVITPAVPETEPDKGDGKPAVYGDVKVNIPAGDDAAGAVKDAAASGGVVSIPRVTEGDPTEVTVSDNLQVAKDKSFEIQLNGNTLVLGTSGTFEALEGSDVTIEGGTIKSTQDGAQLLTKRGEGNVTLKNVNIESNGNFGLSYSPATKGTQTDIKSSVWTLEGVVIYSRTEDGNGTGLWINGLVDGADGKAENAVINITNSVIIGGETGLEVAGNVTVNAKNSAFYGGAAAVQLNSGTSTFTDCTFYGANEQCDNAWNGANGYPDVLKAIFVVIAGKDGYESPVSATLSGCKFVTTNGTLNSTATESDGTEIVAGGTKSGWKYKAPETDADYKKVTLTAIDAGVVNFTVDSATATAIGKLEHNTNVFAFVDHNTTTPNASVSLETLKTLVKTQGLDITEKPAASEQP